MNKSELQTKIAKMEAGLDNPNILGAAREAMIKALGTAKEQLKKMEAKEKATPKVKAQKASPKKADPVKPKPAQKPKRKGSSAKSSFSWLKKANVASLAPMQFKCEFYHQEVKEATRVSLKKTGKTSVVVTAQPGDHIIFDGQGRAMFIMEKGSFAQKCTDKVGAPAAKVNKPKSSKPKAAPKKKAAAPKKPSTSKTKRKPSAPSDYMKAIDTFNKEVDAIRKNYNAATTDQDKLQEELKGLAGKADQKNYVAFVERKIKRLQSDQVRATDAEIIRLGIALRPMVQSIRGTLRDTSTDNKKVLEPSLENLIRWAKSPGQYDLAGVDASAKEKPTVKAKVKQQEKTGFLEWLFG